MRTTHAPRSLWYLALAGSCLLLLRPARAWAQPSVVSHPELTSVGPANGVGGPIVTATQLAGRDGLLVGARAGWFLLDSLVVGAGVDALYNNNGRVSGMELDDGSRVSLGIGGLWVEYVIAPRRPVHAYVGTLIGAGALGYHSMPPVSYTTSTIFVVAPQVAVEVNVAPFLRVSAGIGYRAVSGVKNGSLSNSDLDGLTGSLLFEFGNF